MSGKLKFKYFKFPISGNSSLFGSSILKPIIPLQIGVGDMSLRYAALIDSGADFCIFDAVVGEALGLQVRAGEPVSFGGVQDRGGAIAFIHYVIITVGDQSYNMRIGFSYDIAQHGFGILGQYGFFDLFVVKFDLAKEEVELRLRK